MRIHYTLVLFILLGCGGGGGGSGDSASSVCTTPDCHTELRLWLKSDTGVLTTGSNVDTWEDQSGNALDLSHDTGTQATLQVGVLNSLDVIRFNNGYLSSGGNLGISGDAEITSFIVSEPDDNSGNYCIFGFGDTSILGKNFALCLSYATAGNMNLRFGGGSHVQFGSYSSSWQIYAARKSLGAIDSTTDLWINGSIQSLLNSPSSATPNITDSAFTLGAFNSGGFRYSGDIAELIIINKALSNREVNAMNCYLSERYNISVSTSCN